MAKGKVAASKSKAAAKSKPNHWLVLVLLALAQFMVVLDVSIVNVMLPAVQKAFHMNATSLQWIVTAYTLTFGGFLLLGGRLADLFGRRLMFLVGVTLFTLASLADGLSNSGGMLIICRAVQGLAGALMSPAALSIILVTYREGHERNVALSVWGAVASGGAAAGVLLGGILTQYLDWRWNFFVNVPIGLLVLLTSVKLLDHYKTDREHNHLDLAGAVLATGGLAMLVYALVKAPAYGWGSGRTLEYFAIAIAALVGFIFNESRVKHPLMPLSIFKLRNLRAANLLMLCMTAGMFSIFFFTTLYLQNVLGYSYIKTGLCFLIVPFAVALAATNVPRVVGKIGFKPILMIAPLIVSAGLFWVSFIPVGGSYWTNVAPGMLLLGFGMGCTFVAGSIAATLGVPHHEAGLASGLLNTAQQIGGALGLAVLVAIATSSTTHFLQNLHLQAQPTKLQVAEATVHGFHKGYLVASTFGIAASLIATTMLRNHIPSGPDADVEAAALV